MYYTSREVYEFISHHQNDPIMERKVCHVSGKSFPIYQSDIDFYAKISPTFAGQKFHIPTPTLCPEERQRRRLAFRNERKLYKRQCDFSGKNIISVYSPDKPYKVYDQKIRWSDERDPMSYGRDFDFSKNFIAQLSQLTQDVPYNNLVNGFQSNINSDYTNYGGNNKNCYWVFDAGSLEDCYYGKSIRKSTNLVDVNGSSYSEHSYNIIDCHHCFNCFYAQDCKQSQECYYVIGLDNCHHCLLCTDLQGQSYCIENRQYTKEEYAIKAEVMIESLSKKHMGDVFYSLNVQRIICSMCGFGNDNVFGNYLYNSQNSLRCFDAKNLENCKYCSTISSSQDVCRDCCDYDYFGGSELSYEVVTVGESAYSVLFSLNVRENVSDIYYSVNCNNSSHLFGCVGLRHKSYCVFNKQYTKEEYEQTVAKIINHMITTGERGEFFHPSLSSFGYNETVAREYLPLTKEEALAAGYTWSDYNADPTIPVGADIVDWKTNPDVSGLTDEQALAKIYICEVTDRPYRIISQELVFYRKHHLPLPCRHPDQRHADRMALRAPRELRLRKCDKTGQEMISVYPQDTLFKVYGEEAYRQVVYG